MRHKLLFWNLKSKLFFLFFFTSHTTIVQQNTKNHRQLHYFLSIFMFSKKEGIPFILKYSLHVFAKLLLYEDPFKPYKTKHQAAPFCGSSLFMGVLFYHYFLSVKIFLFWVFLTTISYSVLWVVFLVSPVMQHSINKRVKLQFIQYFWYAWMSKMM